MSSLNAAAILSIVLSSLLSGAARAQAPLADNQGRDPRRPVLAMAEIVALNGLVWAYDRYGMQAEWARISAGTWAENIVSAPEWDHDPTTCNFVGHPIHGAIFFNVARSNGYGYYRGLGFALAGSALWEWFGENYRPSPGDLVNTSLGGAALGEALRRISGLVRASRRLPLWLRRTTATALDPATTLNRRLGGRGSTPSVHPGSIVVMYRAGVSTLLGGDAGSRDLVGEVEVRYGFLGSDPVNRPFDVMHFGLRVGGPNVISRIQVRGALAAAILRTDRTAIGVFQHFDVVSTKALDVGAQSLGAGLVHRRSLVRRIHLTTAAHVGAILLGTMPSRYASGATRHNDYGPGALAKMDVRLAVGHFQVLRAWTDAYVMRGLIKEPATHVALAGGLDVSAPLPAGLRVNAGLEYSRQSSAGNVERAAATTSMELRLSLQWRASGAL